MPTPAKIDNVQIINLDTYTRGRTVTWDLSAAEGITGATGITGYNVYRSEVSYADYEKLNTNLLPPGTTHYSDTVPVTPVTPFQWWYKVTSVNRALEEGSLTEAFPAVDQDINVFINTPYQTIEPKALSEQNKTFPHDGNTFQTLPSTNINPRWFLEIRKRHIWLLEVGGKEVFLIKRRYSGKHELPVSGYTGSPPIPDLPPGTSFDPLRWQHRQAATDTSVDNTYGVGYLGGYHTPFRILVSFINPATRSSKITMYGVESDFEPSNWTIWEPNILDHDIIVRPDNNERYEVLNVTRSNWRGLILHQRFELKLIEPSNIIYRIPVPQL